MSLRSSWHKLKRGNAYAPANVIIRHQEQCLLPLWSCTQRFIDILELPLTLCNIVTRMIARFNIRRDPAECRQLPFGGLFVECGVAIELVNVSGNTRHVPVNQLAWRVVRAWWFLANPTCDVDVDAKGHIVERHGVVNGELRIRFCWTATLIKGVSCRCQSCRLPTRKS